MKKWSLTALADGHLAQARHATTRRSRHVIHRRGRRLRQTVIAMTRGERLDAGDHPGAATLQVLRGRVRLTTDGHTVTGSAGELLIVPDSPYSATAVQDAVVLLTVAVPAPVPTSGYGEAPVGVGGSNWPASSWPASN